MRKNRSIDPALLALPLAFLFLALFSWPGCPADDGKPPAVVAVRRCEEPYR